jgi:hypothetical protein
LAFKPLKPSRIKFKKHKTFLFQFSAKRIPHHIGSTHRIMQLSHDINNINTNTNGSHIHPSKSARLSRNPPNSMNAAKALVALADDNTLGSSEGSQQDDIEVDQEWEPPAVDQEMENNQELKYKDQWEVSANVVRSCH